jgi:transcriptional regulator with XRE-family HTH domain
MASSYISIQFGKRVRRERMRLGYSQEYLGEIAGMHRTYVGMVERAEKNITLTNIAKLAKALRVPVKDLVDFT